MKINEVINLYKLHSNPKTLAGGTTLATRDHTWRIVVYRWDGVKGQPKYYAKLLVFNNILAKNKTEALRKVFKIISDDPVKYDKSKYRFEVPYPAELIQLKKL